MKKFTTKEFYRRFPDDNACLHYLFTLRYGNMRECPQCNKDAKFARVTGRRSYQCANCAYQIYPTQGTVFEKTTTPLLYWFWAIYMFTTTRNGCSAKELERQFSICYKTALRMAHQIKKLIQNRTQRVLTGIVEADELYLGMKTRNMHAWKRKKYQGSHFGNKITVLAMLERNGEIVTEVFGETDAKAIQDAIREKVEDGAILMSDSSPYYVGVKNVGIKHYSVNHNSGEWARGLIHTNSVEGFFSQVRRTIYGTHIHVSTKHLPKYLDEISFRYMMRNRQDEMFDAILHLA